jgi:hypothetical protein
MTGADKTKLDGVATGATANSSNATLLARANHTGTQTASTISDITAAARTVLDDATVAAMVDTLGGAASSGTGGLVRSTGPTISAPVITGVTTYSGASQLSETSLGDFIAHTADGPQLTSTMTTGATLTFDATPSDGRVFGPVRVPANSGGPYTLTIPSSVNVTTGATITTVSVPASGQVELTFRRIGATNYVYGVPASAGASTALADITDMSANARTFNAAADYAAMVNALGGASSTGTGGLVRTTSPTLVTPALGTPASGTLTNCTGLPTAGIVDASVTLAKMANLAQDQFIVRTTASTGVPQTATVTAAARTVLDDATVGDMRTTLSAAARAQTGMMPIFIRTVADETLRLIINAPVALTITNITTRSGSGTCTVTGQIDGTPLGGTANAASTTEQSQAHASANTLSAGADFLLAFSSNSACTGLAVNVHYTYTQA